MARRLVTFLGAPRHPDTSESVADARATRYRPTRYDFGCGELQESAFFGIALYRWLVARGQHVDALVVVGTRASIWDSLYEAAELELDQDWAQLVEAVEAQAVGEAELARLEQRLGERLGIEVRCVRIDEAAEREGQLALLRRLDALFESGDACVIDFTHGYRHYGPLAIESAVLLHQARGVRLEGAYYGMFPATRQGRTPVVRLDALEELASWARAIAVLRQTGSFGRLPELLGAEHPELSTPLEELDFALLTERYDRALRQANQLLGSIRGILKRGEQTSLSALFLGELCEVIAPMTSRHLADWQLAEAQRALSVRAFARAAILAYEALHSAAIGDARRRLDRHARNEVQKAWKNPAVRGRVFEDGGEAYWRLRSLRNALAHGSGDHTDDIEALLESSIRLRAGLEELLDYAAAHIEAFKARPPSLR